LAHGGGGAGVTSLYGALFADRVISVEPDPRAFSELWANARLNIHTVGSRMQVYHHCIHGTDTGSAATGSAATGNGPAVVQMETVWPLGNSNSRRPNLGLTGAAEIIQWNVSCSTLPGLLHAINADAATAIGTATGNVNSEPEFDDAAQFERVHSNRKAAVSFADISLIKIDTEGSEASIVPSLLQWLRDGEAVTGYKPSLFVELHPNYWQESDFQTANDGIAKVITIENEIERTGKSMMYTFEYAE
jgi:hypothetical protein